MSASTDPNFGLSYGWELRQGFRSKSYVNKAAINAAMTTDGVTKQEGMNSYITGTGPVYWNGADWLKVVDNTSAP